MHDWRAIVRSKLAEAGLDAGESLVEELAQHLEDRYIVCLARRATEHEAFAAALAELDTNERHPSPPQASLSQPITTPGPHRGSRLTAPWQAFEQARGELVIASRSLARSPLYALSAISVIALSMALLATAFTLADGTLFRPLPYHAPGELVSIAGSYTSYPENRVPVTRAYLDAWREAVPDATFGGFFDSVSLLGRIGDLGSPVVRAAYIDADLLAVLGIDPTLGGFTTDDLVDAGSTRPALITQNLWQAHLGGRRDVVGQHLEFSFPRNASSVRIAGVLPADFVFPGEGAQPDLLLPMSASSLSASAGMFGVVARLPQGISPVELQLKLGGAAARVAAASGQARSAYGHVDRADVVPLASALDRSRPAILVAVLVSAVALVLLACVNLAGLAAARAEERLRDAAVRRALGASVWTLAREQFSETLILAVAGGLLGLACVPVLTSITLQMLPDSLALLRQPRPDLRVALFVCGTMVTVAALVSLWPAAVAARTGLAQVLGREGSNVTTGGQTGRRTVLAAQIATGLVLTLAGTFVVGSLLTLRAEDPGYDARGLVIVDARHHSRDPAQRRLHAVSVADAVRAALPVGDVATFDGPFLERTFSAAVGWLPPEGADRRCLGGPKIGVDEVFFQLMGVRRVAGRLPTATELRAREPVAVVSERTAALCWPGRDPVGQPVSVGGTVFTVVGVVADARLVAHDEISLGQAYFPLDVLPQPRPEVVIAARVTGSPDRAVPGIVRALQDAGLLSSVARVLPAETALAESVRARRLHAWLFGAFAVSALVIVGAGVLGLTITATSRRTREFGVRSALGATPADVVRLVLRNQRLPLIAGVGAGLVVSWWAIRVVEPYLYGFSLHDARVWGFAVAMLAAVTVGGAIVPALQAGRVDPVRALRE